jgi:UDP-N-acetylglucosamine transferase subunit ALG13
MIFIVVGTQQGFDRLIKSVDNWSATTGYNDIIAQIADASYKPTNFKWFDYIPMNEFNDLFLQADLIVSHAGMGTIISALQYQKPIIVMPRLASFREHRNDHQVATANSFAKLGYVKAAYSDFELFEALNNRASLKPVPPISQHASDQLISSIENYLFKLD